MTTIRALMGIRDSYTGKTHAIGEVWDYAGFEQQIQSLVAMGAIEIVKPDVVPEISAAAVEESAPVVAKQKRGNKHG